MYSSYPKDIFPFVRLKYPFFCMDRMVRSSVLIFMPSSSLRRSRIFCRIKAPFSGKTASVCSEREPSYAHSQTCSIKHGKQKAGHAAEAYQRAYHKIGSRCHQPDTHYRTPAFFIYWFASNRIFSSSRVFISLFSIRIFPPTIISLTSPASPHSNIV